ncbi:TnpV protein [Faecalibacterium sp. AF27-11BH]|uniref:TnpV protein n=1 Tax=Faecalibacterium sp. AF27-11BH TaxID=2302956 RepID=UPI000E746007|nr:TnpV protein [Faecalibacterium sp. AF27-11BH]
MIGRIYHVGLTVSDLDRSVAFYRDILGLAFQGEIFMEGKETDKMFRKSNCKARVAYLNGSKAIETPPVELIQFVDSEIHPHLLEVEQTAESRMRQTMQELLMKNPAPNKEQHQMEWVQHMNSLKAQAEELVMNELIYS